MFVYALKGSTLKFLAVIMISVGMLVALVNLLPDSQPVAAQSPDVKITYSGVKTNEDRIAFLGQFGWLVEPEARETVEVAIPAQFDAVLNQYNTIQKQQGLNLEKLRNKKLMRYTYLIADYPEYDGVVYANLLVYKDRVVGGDICSADINGFMHGFDKNNKPV